MTDVGEIETYLHRHIPISREIGVRVISVDDAGVRLAAPLGPNLNHQSTAFGGSVASLAILAAWTLAHVRLRRAGVSARVVIQKSSVDYTAPIRGELEALSPAPGPLEWERFVSALEKRGRGRLRLHATVLSEGLASAEFQGLYVALRGDDVAAAGRARRSDADPV